MTNQLAIQNEHLDPAIMEQVVINGDLSQLKPEQRVAYYNNVCNSVGLNPLTKPFSYIKLNGKLTLYAQKDATEQLRKLNGISISRPKLDFSDDLVIVSVDASDKSGRTDSDVGIVTIGTLKGDMKANAIMKAVTKAKRRVTLSISGLGWLDESETETIPGAQIVSVTDDGVIDSVVREIKAQNEAITQELVPTPENSNPKPSATMSLEEAEAVQNSEGDCYGDLETSTLSHMANSITKAMKKDGLTDEKIAEYQYKKDAIGVILASRNKPE